MKKLTPLFTLLFLFSVALAQTNPSLFVPANNGNIQYIGRFDFSDKSKPVFMYSGTAVKTSFTGTSVSIKLLDDSLRNWFTVILDDSIFSFEANKKDGLYLLAKNLLNKKHNLEITRRTEWHGGNTTFEGFMIDAGKKLLPVAKRKRTIEFIGDSYTCGYGNEGKSREEHFTYATENNYLSYGAIVARALQADYVGICRSGIGMYQGYGGDTKFAMPDFYNAVINNKKSVWNYAALQPAMVVIDLSGNDFSAKLDSIKFTAAYLKFLTSVRKNYPKAIIVCAAGPSGTGEKFNTQRNYVQAVVNTFQKNNKWVYYFAFSPVGMNGSDWHPNVAEHKNMADELIPFLKTIAHW